MLSAECTLSKQPDYMDMHLQCSQPEDVPLPHGRGLLLQPRCGCPCQARIEGAS